MPPRLDYNNYLSEKAKLSIPDGSEFREVRPGPVPAKNDSFSRLVG